MRKVYTVVNLSFSEVFVNSNVSFGSKIHHVKFDPQRIQSPIIPDSNIQSNNGHRYASQTQ